ncbi:MAG: cytochrome c3 family protein [Planctomycetota bacterium]
MYDSLDAAPSAENAKAPSAAAHPVQGAAALWRNTMTIIGGMIGMVALFFMISFLIIEVATPLRSPYLGMFTFLVFPGVLVFGVILCALGLVRSRRRFRKRYGRLSAYHLYPRLDLNNPRHRRYVVVSAACVALTIPVIGVLSYEGYHYTDSNDFCGKVCHTVMEPQFTAYQQSPHAKVSCAQCHIGTGASWYVKSKLSGTRQVIAVALNSFPRPIPPAIQELRPATETCRQCHWPSKFYGDQLVTIDHFAPDEANTHSRMRMLLKTGGSDPSTGPPSGIHWHMALGFTIEYIATDERLQEIPWVRMVDQATGREAIYRADGLKSTDPLPQGTRRTVDCMDCHNRPTHVFRSPDRAVDSALNVSPLLQSLPYAKRELVRVLAEPYPTKEKGLATITRSLAEFYQHKYPKVWEQQKKQVDGLILAGKEIYENNFFPEMNVSWRTYPNNIGHKIYPGCFRCHEGRHKDDTGRVLSHNCGSCHDFMTPVEGDDKPSLVRTGGFEHPYKLEGSHAALRCDQCHTGGMEPAPNCAGCHTTQVQFRAGTLAAFSELGIPGEPMAETVDCQDCHDLSKPRTIEAIDPRCMDCHGDEPDKFKGMLGSWKAEIDHALHAASGLTDPVAQARIEALRKAGPLHNIEAARRVLQSLGISGAVSTTPSDVKADPTSR